MTRLDAPWLEMTLAQPMQVFSFTLNTPGFTMAERILWREVCNADLPENLDVSAWLAQELAARGAVGTPCFLTSRRLAAFTETCACIEGITARCVTTLGLSNAERIGQRVPRAPGQWGTINIALELDLPLAQPGLIEALSMIAQARTTALIDSGAALPSGAVTGTGTDCIAVAAPVGRERYAGLHTAQGEAIGRATYDAVLSAAKDWLKEREHETATLP